MKKKYLYLSSNRIVAYDENQCYINNSTISKIEGVTSEQQAKDEAFRQMSTDLKRYLINFDHIAVLTAAGTSIDNGNGDNCGKTRNGLWKFCEKEINEIIKTISATTTETNKECERIKKDNDIETLLSYAISYEKLYGSLSQRQDLEKKIVEACMLQLDTENTHHAMFIRKLTARKPNESRVQLFTTNYDTLFEQAAQKIGYVVIDGFSFSMPRQFNGRNFEYDIVYREGTRVKQEESFIPNVIQLFKLHGSVNWDKESNGNICQKENPQIPCIIYPAAEKFEMSYEQPYFEMMSHFQRTLRQENTLLIVVGFGFKDKHIQRIIDEAVRQNTHFHLLIVCYGGTDGITSDLVNEFAKNNSVAFPNISIIFSTFKDFVEHIPFNTVYTNEENENETIRS